MEKPFVNLSSSSNTFIKFGIRNHLICFLLILINDHKPCFGQDYIDKNIYRAGKRVWMAEEDLKEAKEEFIQCLKTLEGELGDKVYFGGREYWVCRCGICALNELVLTVIRLEGISA
ncbi:hypothetical protein CRYUN_Cryun09bG0160600 [Craigia yunnanensis]